MFSDSIRARAYRVHTYVYVATAPAPERERATTVITFDRSAFASPPQRSGASFCIRLRKQTYAVYNARSMQFAAKSLRYRILLQWSSRSINHGHCKGLGTDAKSVSALRLYTAVLYYILNIAYLHGQYCLCRRTDVRLGARNSVCHFAKVVVPHRQ